MGKAKYIIIDNVNSEQLEAIGDEEFRETAIKLAQDMYEQHGDSLKYGDPVVDLMKRMNAQQIMNYLMSINYTVKCSGGSDDEIKFVAIRQIFDTDGAVSHWTIDEATILNTLNDAERYCAENIKQDVIVSLNYDIDDGADAALINELQALIDKCDWDALKANERAMELMAELDYDFGYVGERYEFGYRGSDADPWAVKYQVEIAKEVK